MTRLILAMPGLVLGAVQTHLHIRAARAYVCVDVIRRIMLGLDGQLRIRLGMGITDVDDKILRRAASEQVPWTSLSRNYELDFFQSLRRFNVRGVGYLILPPL